MSQRNNHQNSALQKSTFLPMLCSRPSIKNVTIPKPQDYSSPPLSLQEDPLSPKISCIGQVKRHNKIIGFPTAAATTTTNNNNNNKVTMITFDNTYHIPYFRLKRFFSRRNHTAATETRATTTTVMVARRRRRGGGEKKGELEKGYKVVDEKGVVINIVDLDPPLPVIKKKQEGGEKKTENLWKRRSGGTELGNLQLQRIKPNLQHQMILQPTTV